MIYEILHFLKQFELILYFVLSVWGVIYVIQFLQTWQKIRWSRYELEKNVYKRKINRLTIFLFLIILSFITIFFLVTFVEPLAPVEYIVPTVTVDVLAENDQAQNAQATLSFDPETIPTVEIDQAACIPEQLNITSPTFNESISGTVNIEGTVKVENFGFYKFEVLQSNGLWLTIQAGRNQITDGVLVEAWDTTRVPNGNYILQLVVSDNKGEELAPCRIPVAISNQLDN